MIGLWRESDRLALTSDCFYTLDPQTGLQGARRACRTPPSTRTPSRRARRSASSPSSSRRRPGRATPTRCVGDVKSQLLTPRRCLDCQWAGDRGAARRRAAPQLPPASARVARRRAAARAAHGPDAEDARRVRATCVGGSPLSQEDAWQRGVEFLFERLAVSWRSTASAPRASASCCAAARRDARRAPLRARRARARTAPSGSPTWRRRERRSHGRPDRRGGGRRVPGPRAARRPAGRATAWTSSRGQKVLVRSTTLARPLLLELQRAILERDAWPVLRGRAAGRDGGLLRARARPRSSTTSTT